MLSVRSCRASRPLPAPSAAQTASVRRRVTPRARSSPATLMQAINKTSVVAAASASSAGRYSPTISSSSGTTRTSTSGVSPADWFRLTRAINSSLLRCRMVRASVAACAGDTPGRSLPSALNDAKRTKRCSAGPSMLGGVNGGMT